MSVLKWSEIPPSDPGRFSTGRKLQSPLNKTLCERQSSLNVLEKRNFLASAGIRTPESSISWPSQHTKNPTTAPYSVTEKVFLLRGQTVCSVIRRELPSCDDWYLIILRPNMQGFAMTFLTNLCLLIRLCIGIPGYVNCNKILWIAVRTVVSVYKQNDFVMFCRVVFFVATGIYRIFVCENGLPVMEK
jgi:hypothetical protein